MEKRCVHCQRTLAVTDLDRPMSAAMDHDRKKAGLHGVRFRSFHCSRCGGSSFFIEVRAHGKEPPEQVEQRRAELRQLAGQMPAVVLLEEGA